MMKYSIDDIAESLSKAEVGNDERDKVLSELQKLADELKADKQPSVKKVFVLIANNDSRPDKISETPMFVAQIEEDFDHTEVIPTIHKAIKTYKESPRKNKAEINSIADALINIPKKDFKDYGIMLKTKEPVIILTTSPEE